MSLALCLRPRIRKKSLSALFALRLGAPLQLEGVHPSEDTQGRLLRKILAGTRRRGRSAPWTESPEGLPEAPISRMALALRVRFGPKFEATKPRMAAAFPFVPSPAERNLASLPLLPSASQSPRPTRPSLFGQGSTTTHPRRLTGFLLGPWPEVLGSRITSGVALFFSVPEQLQLWPGGHSPLNSRCLTPRILLFAAHGANLVPASYFAQNAGGAVPTFHPNSSHSSTRPLVWRSRKRTSKEAEKWKTRPLS